MMFTILWRVFVAHRTQRMHVGESTVNGRTSAWFCNYPHEALASQVCFVVNKKAGCACANTSNNDGVHDQRLLLNLLCHFRLLLRWQGLRCFVVFLTLHVVSLVKWWRKCNLGTTGCILLKLSVSGSHLPFQAACWTKSIPDMISKRYDLQGPTYGHQKWFRFP